MKYIFIIVTITMHTIIVYPEEPPKQQQRIIGDRVRMRQHASTKSKVISILNKGERVIILEKNVGHFFFIGKYLGAWWKIAYQGKKGYVFSAFIETIDEKFHIFYNRFYKSIKGAGNFALDRTKIPIDIFVFNIEAIKYEKVTVKDRTRSIFKYLSGDGLPLVPKYRYTNKHVYVFIDYQDTDSFNEYVFKQYKGRWFLVRLKVG